MAAVTSIKAGSRLERVLRSGRFAVTAELNPPDSADPQAVYDRALVLASVCDGINATDASGETFAGVAYETVDNSAGSAGDLEIRVETTGTFVFVDGGGNGAQTDVGVTFKVVDNQTVTDAATTNNIVAGIAVESISSTSVRIRISRYAS